jgi:hypothetical protein
MEDHFRSEEEYLAAIRKSIEEGRVPEGFDVEAGVTRSIKGYWDNREKYVKEQRELELTTAKLARRVAKRLGKMETEGQEPAYSFVGKYIRTMAEEARGRIRSYLQK